jgi:hypothetical protein
MSVTFIDVTSQQMGYGADGGLPAERSRETGSEWRNGAQKAVFAS